MRCLLQLRRLYAAFPAAMLCVTLAHAQVDDVPRDYDIPAGELSQAVNRFSQQSNLQVIYDLDLLKDMNAPAVRGRYAPREILSQLLSGTGLQWSYANDNTIVLRKQTASISATHTQLQTLKLAQADAARSAPADEPKTSTVEEIVVTAQKRAERLQDVPVPMTAVNAASLAVSGQLRLQDYYARVPGLDLALIGSGNGPSVAIRGVITGGQTNPTVGTVVDDVSYGATVTPGLSPTMAEVDPGDLARIEVLRGPQGTLYGASSIGGLVKFVTIDPSTEGVSGRVQAGVQGVHKSSELGHSLRASINVPLGETFAVRASGFTSREPGYIDNASNGASDINGRDSSGGRLAALWRPSDAFSLKLNAQVQTSKRKGIQDSDVTFGEDSFIQRALPDTGLYERDSQAYSALMSARLGPVELTSVTGYNRDEFFTRQDILSTVVIGRVLQPPPTGFSVDAVAAPLRSTIDKFSQELRASLPLGRRLDWMFGVFYTGEEIDTHLNYLAANATTGATVGTYLTQDAPSTFDEYAAFTTLTVSMTDRLDVQFGGRFSRSKQFFSGFRSGPGSILFFGTNPSIVPDTRGEDDAFTYLVTPRFKFSRDLMVYARLASGYRPGGPNANCGSAIPCEFGPDSTKNYEAGMKGNTFDGRLSFDASVYYIDWQDVQISLLDALTRVVFTENAAEAVSRGVELSVETHLWEGSTLSAWGAWNEAELAANLPSTSTVVGRDGDRLPYSSRFSSSVSIDQQFPLGSRATGFLGASASFVGDRKGVLRSTLVRETYPRYRQFDLTAGVRLDTWTLNAFVNNVTDERGILRGGLDAVSPTFFAYIQPRTGGFSLTKTF